MENEIELYSEIVEHITNMYRAMAPHANYENGGNRFADDDQIIIKLRKKISDITGDK